MKGGKVAGSSAQPNLAEERVRSLAEPVLARHGADLVVHGHAHHGKPDGRTSGGVPVHNVSISLLQAQNPSQVYRVFDV